MKTSIMSAIKENFQVDTDELIFVDDDGLVGIGPNTPAISLHILSDPQPQACLRISADVIVDVSEKPSWWFRFWHKVLLGWTWEEKVSR